MRKLAAAVLSIFLLAGCGDDGATEDDDGGGSPGAVIEIVASAGPVCPVETDPPDPECAPRPVEDATVVVTAAEGEEVGRGTTGPDGRVVIEVVPGEVTVVPQPVEGLLGTAPPVTVTVTAGDAARVEIEYDTGIR